MSDDLIRRSDAIKAVNKAKAEGMTECPTYYLGIVPTIDVVPKDFHDKTCEAMAKRHTEEIQRLMPKRGEWIEPTDDESISITGRCSNCGWESHLLEDDVVGMPFCPNCGCAMAEREGK